MRKIILLFVLSGVVFYYLNRNSYLPKYDYQISKKSYEQSQWVNPNSQKPMGDADLYAFAGVSYIYGIDPILINPEMPPLGKQLIGFLILLFHSQNLSGLIFGFFALFFLYLLSVEVLKSKLLALIVILIFALEKIFQEQLTTSLLDLPLLSFMLLSFYFLIKSFQKPKFFIIAGIFSGFVLGIKIYVIGLILMFTLVITGIINKIPKKILVLGIGLGVFVYFLSYYSYFFHAHSLREFIGLHKWILNFYRSSLVSVFWGSPFYLLLFNRWETWWSGGWFGVHNIISVPGWNFMWPVITLLFFLRFILLSLKKIDPKSNNTLPLTLWCTFYLIFLFTSPVWPRYFLLLTPFFYILGFELFFRKIGIIKLLVYLKRLVGNRQKLREVFLFLVITILGVSIWYIFSGGGNLIFNSEIARDWFKAERIYQFKDLAKTNFISRPYLIYLASLFLLFDGNVLGFWIALLLICFAIGVLVFFLNRNLIFCFLAYFLTLLLLCYSYKVFNSNNHARWYSKLKAVNAALKDNNEREFGLEVFDNIEQDYAYIFLFDWYGFKNGFTVKDLETQKPKVIYLVFNDVNNPLLKTNKYKYHDYGRETARLVFPFSIIIRRDL